MDEAPILHTRRLNVEVFPSPTPRGILEEECMQAPRTQVSHRTLRLAQLAGFVALAAFWSAEILAQSQDTGALPGNWGRTLRLGVGWIF